MSLIADLQYQDAIEVALHVDVPGLYIGVAIIERDRVGIGHALAGLLQETGVERERVGGAGGYGVGFGEWRLLGEVLLEFVVLVWGVIPAVATADLQLALGIRFPRECRARREIISIRFYQRGWIDSAVGAGCTGDYWRNSGEAGSDIQIRRVAVLFRPGREIFVAEAQVQTESGVTR